jgi:ABC-type branched-subunit amino acid transport system ATPase component
MLQPGTAEVVFPEIVNGAGWTTQINLFSGVTNHATSGTLTFVRPDGTSFNIGTNKLH